MEKRDSIKPKDSEGRDICFECGKVGEVKALIFFDPRGEFEVISYVESHDHHYTCCAKPEDFEEAKVSRFMVIPSASTQLRFPTLREGKCWKISEEELQRRLPKIYASLTKEKAP